MTVPRGRAYSLVVSRPEGGIIVAVEANGTPHYGEGVTADSVWAEIARAYPTPR